MGKSRKPSLANWNLVPDFQDKHKTQILLDLMEKLMLLQEKAKSCYDYFKSSLQAFNFKCNLDSLPQIV